jgi:hypothetical protein
MWAGPCGAGERHRKGCGVWCSGRTRRRSGASAPSRAAPAPDLASTARPVASPLRRLSAPSCLPSTNEYPGCPRLPGEHAASSSADATTDALRCDAMRCDAMRCDAMRSVPLSASALSGSSAATSKETLRCQGRPRSSWSATSGPCAMQCNAMRCGLPCRSQRSRPLNGHRCVDVVLLESAVAPGCQSTNGSPGGSFVLPLAVYRAQRYTRRSAAVTQQCRVATSALHLVGT